MKRSYWITLLVLAALNAILVCAGVVALAGAKLSPDQPMPTLIAAVALPAASATLAPVGPSATPIVVAETTLEPTPSPEPVISSPAVEPSATETPAEPTTVSAPTDLPAPATPTAGVILVPPPMPQAAATETSVGPAAEVLPVATATQAPTDTPTSTPSLPPTATPTLTPSGPLAALFVPATAHASEIFLQGQSFGNRPNVFALVGDSNTDNPNFFAPFESGNYSLGEYAYLQATIDFFRGSFAQHSPAAVGSFNTSKVLDPAYADPARCLSGETPLACEYRLQRPSVALILIGTGDHLDWPNFEGRYRRILDFTLAQGIIPVLLTKADDLESKEQGAPYEFTNNVIRRLGQEYDLPLLDLRRAVEGLPNRGCVADGFHYNTPPDGRSADFTGDHLNYGYNMRNFTALMTLDELRRQVLQP